MKHRFNRGLFLKMLFLSFHLTLIYSGPLFAGGDEVRNGGDHIRIIFNEGRSKAVDALKNLDVRNLGSHFSASTLEWLQKNALTLAADLEQSQLVWNNRLPENCSNHVCACTGLTEKAIIHLSLAECNGRFVDSNYAAKLLIHEAVHHFGQADESFADEVAIAVHDQSRESRTQKLLASLDVGSNFFVEDTAQSTDPSLTKSLLFFLRQRGVVHPNGGAGVAYNHEFNEHWAGEINYSFLSTEFDALLQSFGFGLRRYLAKRKISPYIFSRLFYDFYSYENEDLADSKSTKYGALQLSAGLGLETNVWENIVAAGDIERIFASQTYGTDSTTLPAADWSMRLGLGVKF